MPAIKSLNTEAPAIIPLQPEVRSFHFKTLCKALVTNISLSYSIRRYSPSH